MRILRHLITHTIALVIGIALGIYLLPILIAPEAPSDSEIMAAQEKTIYRGTFRKDLPGSDLLHWGEGELSITPTAINFIGSISPGPDYQLYLTDKIIETEQDFLDVRAISLRVGPVKTFNNFIVPISDTIDLNRYSAVLIWCESFSKYITAASFR